MGTIARSIKCLLILQVALYQVSSLNPPPSQYLVTNFGPAPIGLHQNVPRPNVPLSALSNSAPSVPSPKPPPVVPKPPENVSSGPLDSNVLNNLAIALQLLIVSNILNMPAVESPEIPDIPKFDLAAPKSVQSSPYMSYSSAQSPISSIVEQALSKPVYEAQAPLYSYEPPSKPLYSYEAPSKPLYSYETPSKHLYSYEAPPKHIYSYKAPPKSLYSYESQPKPVYSYEAPMPNANFLGSSGLAEPVFGSSNVVRPNPRSGMTLMSPYDALGTSSFGDSLSSFSSYTKNDFQSPYASMLAADDARDIFSIPDFF